MNFNLMQFTTTCFSNYQKTTTILCFEFEYDTVCLKSLVHFEIAARYIRIEKTFCAYSMSPTLVLLAAPLSEGSFQHSLSLF